MKIQGLAVIFIIIIIPITIIIGEYASTQIEIFRLEQAYDSRLITATYDALKAFQINTFNDANSDIADSKINSIEASANAFYNGLESGFELEGYSKENLKMYVPALVYTMYDGYYIYSPYRNVADITEGNGKVNIDLTGGDIEYGFKPYVYYSCRYVNNNENIDVIINFSLDNYITVQGIIDEKEVYKSGYLLTIADTKKSEGVYYDEDEKKYYYSGIEILVETNLSDYLLDKDSSGSISSREYKYVKLNGTKYYLNEKDDDGDGIIDEYIFYINGGNRVKQVTKSINEQEYNRYLYQIQTNTSAISYYRSAYEFTQWVNEKLGSLESKHAQIDDDRSGVKNSVTGKIFENKQIEYPGSNFNLHRKEVIRYSIESNLSVAIANFNSYSNSTNDFQMPKLKENEWEMLENEVSIISFLQGLSLGGKIYNGYTVVTNDKTEEVVKEERIYINVNEDDDDGADYYHKVNDKHFTAANKITDNEDDIIAGVLDLDFELRKDGVTGHSYTQKNQLACYTSIVGQDRVNNEYESIYEYLQNLDNSDLVLNKTKQLYYTALGRERWGTYKLENSSNLGDLLRDMLPMNNYDIVTDGLIRFYHGENVDGQGNVGNEGTTVWEDLSGNYDAILINGAKSNTNGYITFDGINDWANCGVVDLDYATINLKMELLKDYAGGSNSYYLFNNWETNKTGLGLLIRPNGQLHFEFYDELSENHSVSSGVIMQPNKIYDITGTFDGNQIKLYINGVLKKVQPVSGKINGPKDNTVLGIAVNTDGSGVDTWSKYANMNVHSVKVYDRALTEEEVVQNYNAMK